MTASERSIRVLAAATVLLCFLWPVVFVARFFHSIRMGYWAAVVGWVVVAIVTCRPLMRRIRGRLDPSELPSGTGAQFPKRDVALLPWELATVNPLLVVASIRHWNSLPGILALGIAAAAVGLALLGRRLERLSEQ
jgi:hypothetical protein